MNEDIDKDKDYQIMELKQRISYYEPYKQKYEDLKEDWKYIKSLLDKEFNERTRLKKENEQLEKGKMEALSLLGEEIDKNEQLKYDNFMFKEVIKTFQKVAISERKKLEKEIEESKITIQLYETDVSMRDNFLKSKGLYDEFLQCMGTVNE